MVRFDWTITLGTLLVAGTFAFSMFVAYTKATRWLEGQLVRFQVILDRHTEDLEKHAKRMDRYEERYVTIANQLQWLIGRMEGDRRQGHRSGNHGTDD
jgi:Na+-transporting NADH:ubiquinone oxidoreductase subunit NqrB